jgi:hypothetical protein
MSHVHRTDRVCDDVSHRCPANPSESPTESPSDNVPTCYRCDKPVSAEDAVAGVRSHYVIHIDCLPPDLRELYLATKRT